MTESNNIQPKTTSTVKRRVISYITLFIFLFFVFLLLSNVRWVGNKQIHTIMEMLATILSGFVGVLALLRYYTKNSNTFLFIGTGFLGTSFLDLYHTVATSTFFEFIWQNPPESLIPWSWNASRYFLAVMMVISWIAWKKEQKVGPEKGAISTTTAYISVGLFTFVSFAFFLLYPLPRAYYPELPFGRPEEFGAAVLFLIALIGYLKKGLWKKDQFEHWVIYSLITGFMAQTMFMSKSYQLFDTMFDAAHTLKKVSYIFVLIGLLYGMYSLFKEAENSKNALLKNSKQIQDAKNQAEKEKITAEEAFIKAEASKKEVTKLNQFMTGRELKMVKLKEENAKLKNLIEGTNA